MQGKALPISIKFDCPNSAATVTLGVSSIDLYAPQVKTTDPTDLGIVTLPDGQPVFKVTITGKNSRSSDNNFGLDLTTLALRPVPKVKMP